MGLPEKQGLYDPRNEHDSCGVGFVANIKGRKSHEIIAPGLQILVNLDHRGAVGADPLVGDGAGCLIQIPDALLRDWARQGRALDLPPPGDYAVAMCFLPQDEAARRAAVEQFEHFLRVEGQPLLGWRDVPIDTPGLGEAVLATMPVIRQAFIGRGPNVEGPGRLRAQAAGHPQADPEPARRAGGEAQPAGPGAVLHAVASRRARWSTRACCSPARSAASTSDLRDPLTESALALVHQRFSTNTFPSWKLAHPYRFIAHNGEINTVRGNVNWMNARRRTLESTCSAPTSTRCGR